MIFSYLPLTPKKNATATCKLWSRLIREDPKLSGRILIYRYNMETALETFQWNWSNWPVLQTLELKSHPLSFDSEEDTRKAMQSAIEKLSLKDCPASLEEVHFDFDLRGQSQTTFTRGGGCVLCSQKFPHFFVNQNKVENVNGAE